MSLLALNGVHVEFRSAARGIVRAVAGVDLSVERGEVLGLVGESGCGKSTLARAAAGLIAPSSGSITFDEQPVTPVRWRRRPAGQTGLQMIFQDPYGSLNPRRTIRSQLLDGIPPGTGAAARADRVVELLERVAMPARAAERYPHQFSGGQRQRLAIARALAAEPKMIIADEPVTALDASAQAQVVSLLLSLVKDLGMGMMFISHDLALVHEIADRTAVMYLGRIAEAAPTRRLMATPRHPYSQALVRAIPQISATPTLPEALLGEVPDGADIPIGCRFRPRCPYAAQVCLTEPELRPALGSTLACWRAEEIAGVGAVPALGAAGAVAARAADGSGAS